MSYPPENHTPALLKPLSRMNRGERAALVAEAKAEIPSLLAAVCVLHERMLKIGTPEAIEYAAVIEDQAGLLGRILDVNRGRAGR